MKVFIVGINGRVGCRIARQLVDSGHEVDGLVRQPASAKVSTRDGIARTPGDLVAMSIEELSLAMRGSDAIVFTAGATGRAGRQATAKVDGEGPPKLAAAAEIAGIRRFVLVSVFPEAWRERQMPEDFEYYMTEKKSAETKIVLTDLDWVIIRPSALTDTPGQGQVELGVAKIHAMIPRDDLAATVVEVLQTPSVSRVILEVNAGSTPIRQAVANVLRHQAPSTVKDAPQPDTPTGDDP